MYLFEIYTELKYTYKKFYRSGIFDIQPFSTYLPFLSNKNHTSSEAVAVVSAGDDGDVFFLSMQT